MLSYANITSNDQEYNQPVCLQHADSISGKVRDVMHKDREEKNGAHSHLSQLQKLRASKYSRHVVLCKKIIKQN